MVVAPFDLNPLETNIKNKHGSTCRRREADLVARVFQCSTLRRGFRRLFFDGKRVILENVDFLCRYNDDPNLGFTKNPWPIIGGHILNKMKSSTVLKRDKRWKHQLVLDFHATRRMALRRIHHQDMAVLIDITPVWRPASRPSLRPMTMTRAGHGGPSEQTCHDICGPSTVVLRSNKKISSSAGRSLHKRMRRPRKVTVNKNK